jgi:hypothetical protein
VHCSRDALGEAAPALLTEVEAEAERDESGARLSGLFSG